MRIKNLGFTLIETVVVFAIIAILSTIAIASFVNYNRAQNVQVAYSELSSTLALARSKALSQAKPQVCVNNNLILNAYEVVLSTFDNTYKLYAVCSGAQYLIQPVTSLPKNVVFDTTKTTSLSFYFSVITNGVTFDKPNVSSASIYIYLTGYQNDGKTIIVNSVGTIK